MRPPIFEILGPRASSRAQFREHHSFLGWSFKSIRICFAPVLALSGLRMPNKEIAYEVLFREE
jgi:hypothetical protein